MAKVKVRGKGSVYKMERGKSRGKCRKWQLRAEIDGEFEGDEGYVKTRVFHGTYSEAQDAKDEFVAAIERGEVRRERGMLFPAYAEAWLAERAAKVAYDTLQKNRCHIVCANMHLSKARIEEIRPGRAPGCDVQGPQKRREPFRQALVRNLRARHIRDAPQDVPGCGEGGRRRLQPVRVRRAAGHRHGAAHPPPVEGIRALVDSLDPRKPMEFALRAAVGSGMRRGEIVGLDVRDIDFEAGEIHVVHGTDSLGWQKDTKTAASKRALPMPASLKADLRERIAAIEEMFAETRKETGSPWPVLGDDTPLMCNELGEKMRPHSVTRWWGCHRDGYGCQGMTLHDMRHSYLTAMARKKTDPKVLQVLAGHAKYSTTMDIYTHVDMAQKHEAVEAMDW